MTVTVTVGYELAPVAYPDGPACAFDGRPGEWPDCCADHRRPMCGECRGVRGAHAHRDPAEI